MKLNFKAVQMLLIAVAIFAVSCAPKQVRYKMDEPNFTEVNISGLYDNQEIIEISDHFKGKYADGNEFYVVVFDMNNYLLGTINIKTGKVENLRTLEIDEYAEGTSIYWNKLEVSEMGAGEKCMGICCASTAFGGTVDSYGFQAKKEFWNDPDHQVQISFQTKTDQSSHSTGYGYYSSSYSVSQTTSGVTQQFVRGDNFVKIDNYSGYASAFATRSVQKARYYPLSQYEYIGFQPNGMGSTSVADFFVYDTKNNPGSSWGADMDFKEGKYYVDAAVPKDASFVAVVTGIPGSYKIRNYDTARLVRSVKSLMTVQD